MDLTLFDIRNADWSKVRYHHARLEELKELEKQRQETKMRSAAAKKVWHERKNKEDQPLYCSRQMI